MEDIELYLTIWQVAERWADETKRPVIDVLQMLKRHSVNPTDGSLPVLLCKPTAHFNPKGECNEYTRFASSRLMPGRTDRTNLSTDDFIAGLNALNNSIPPAAVTPEVITAFNQFAYRREDFREGCLKLGKPLPRFWFPKEGRTDITQGQEQTETDKEPGEIPPAKNKRTIHDNTGSRRPFSLMTAIDTCLQAFYRQHGERKPGGKSAIGEFVDFIEDRYKAQPKDKTESNDKFMENIVDLKAKARGDSKRFICLKANLSAKYPKGQHWHSWHTFENQFGNAIRNFTPIQLTAEKNTPIIETHLP